MFFFSTLAQNIIAVDSVRFIGWFAPFCACIDVGWYSLQAAVFHVLCEKGYEQGTYFCENLYFKLEMACMNSKLLINGVIFGNCSRAMTLSHYFAIFRTLCTLLKLMIYTFMGYVLTSIDILFT